jgi:hypothetical protein
MENVDEPETTLSSIAKASQDLDDSAVKAIEDEIMKFKLDTNQNHLKKLKKYLAEAKERDMKASMGQKEQQ